MIIGFSTCSGCLACRGPSVRSTIAFDAQWLFGAQRLFGMPWLFGAQWFLSGQWLFYVQWPFNVQRLCGMPWLLQLVCDLRHPVLAGGCFGSASPSGLVGAIPFVSSGRLLAALFDMPWLFGAWWLFRVQRLFDMLWLFDVQQFFGMP